MDHPITVEQVLLAKRTAMERFFFIPAAEDNDNGFDRLMTMRSKDEIDAASKTNGSGWGGIYLEESWQGHELENIQKWVFKDAIRLISVMCRVSPEVALDELRKHRSEGLDCDEEMRAHRDVEGVLYESSLLGVRGEYKH